MEENQNTKSGIQLNIGKTGAASAKLLQNAIEDQ